MAPVTLIETGTTTGIFGRFHTPHVLFGQSFTWWQVVSGPFLVFYLTPWAVWIISVAIGTALIFKQKGVTIKILYFIFGFILAMLVDTPVPAARPLGPLMVALAKIGLPVTLFFIGAGLLARVVRSVGPQALHAGRAAVGSDFDGLALRDSAHRLIFGSSQPERTSGRR
jgi:hypothetical protein